CVGQRAVMLDRPVGEAPPGVEDSGRLEGLRGTGSKTAHAGAAPLRDRLGRGEGPGPHPLREKDTPGPPPGGQTAARSEPPEAGGRGERTLAERCRVDADPVTEPGCETPGGSRCDALGALSNRAVVVRAAGISRDRRAVLRAEGSGRVRVREADDRSRSR